MTINLQAFEELERILTKIEDDGLSFTLGDWCELTTKTNGPFWRRSTEVCDIAFCLMGWAAQDPWFIENGFRLSGEPGDKPVVFYDGAVEWEAVSNFLGIDLDEAVFLLDGGHYGRDAIPTEVGVRLRAFVRSKDGSGNCHTSAETSDRTEQDRAKLPQKPVRTEQET